MRDELGICYYVRSSNSSYDDHGYLAIKAGVDNTRVAIAIENIMIELNKLKNELVSKEEIKKAKDFISGGTALGLETSDSRADYVGFQELLKKEIKTPEEKLKLINKVTPKQVKDLANEILVENTLNLAMIGPYKDEKEFLPFLKFKNK
jgi:predicted Zn-dependent peptidase